MFVCMFPGLMLRSSDFGSVFLLESSGLVEYIQPFSSSDDTHPFRRGFLNY